MELIDNPSPGALNAIRFLCAWLNLVDAPVKETKLLLNYPSPFNPETWIPYQLAKDADVSGEIYNPIGQLVRTLDLGFQSRGRYLSREEAAYWDGHNDDGEKVASGVYFYVFEAGDYAQTQKMVILK